MIGYAYTGLMGVEVGSVGLVYGLGEGAAVYENPRIQQNIWLMVHFCDRKKILVKNVIK